MPALYLRTDHRHISLFPARIWLLCPFGENKLPSWISLTQAYPPDRESPSICSFLVYPSLTIPFTSEDSGSRSSISLRACLLPGSLQCSPRRLLSLTVQVASQLVGSSESLQVSTRKAITPNILSFFIFNFLKIQGAPVMAQLPTSPLSLCLFLSPSLLLPLPPDSPRSSWWCDKPNSSFCRPSFYPRQEGCFLMKASSPWEEFLYQLLIR